jgi:hypothetical protein
MIRNRKHTRYGYTVSEWVPMNVPELERDAVSLSSIIIDGRDGFKFDGDDLDVFVSMCIQTLLENGALPVIGGGDSKYDWIYQHQYGVGSGNVIRNVLAEWKASGADPDLGGLWFARPDPNFPEFFQLD